jgi:hypothetical protein
MKIGISRQFLATVSHVEIKENLSSRIGGDTKSQTDGLLDTWTDMASIKGVLFSIVKNT